MARAEKLQQQAEELCGALIRAVSGEAQLRYRGRHLELNGRPFAVRTPHLRTDVEKDDFRSFRGAADGIALRLKHSDPQLHRELMPDDDIGAMIFEMLEQLRVESLVSAAHPGARQNMLHRFHAWTQEFHNSGTTESHVGLLIYSIAQICWSRMTGLPADESTEGLVEPQRMMLAPHIGTYLAGMRRTKADQAAYAENALGIVAVVAGIVDALNSALKGKDEDAEEVKLPENLSNFNLLLDLEDGDADLGTSTPGSRMRCARELAKQLENYQVFSRNYDREVASTALVRKDLLVDLRDRLDKRIAGQGINIPRLARELSLLLAAPRLDGWNFGEEEGYLDGRRLSSLVTSPDNHKLFRQERYQPHSNCQVTFLLDNSGSMREHIESIAMMVDVFARALEQAGAKSEVLGFTTGAWQGGRAYKEWLRKRRPENPGRLAELCHIVYKDAGLPWRQARRGMAALLKPDLFREGIDGEAVLWAAKRMAARPEQRKILIVVSDGCPMESATHQTNSEDFLDNHLKQVASMLELGGDIELYGLGVGLDLGTYYRHHLAMDTSVPLDNGMFREIMQMISRRR